MKRVNLVDRWTLLSDKRQQLLHAAREAAKTYAYPADQFRAEREVENRALDFAVAVQRYIGGHRP